MKKNLLYLPLLSLCFLFCISACTTQVQSGEKVRIALQPKKGDKSNLRYTTTQVITQKMMGMSVKVEQVTDLYMKHTVESKNEQGISSIRVMYERVKFSQENAMTGKTEWDSQTASPDEETPAMATGYASMVGKSFVMKVNETGKVVEVIGVDVLYANMTASLEEMPGGAEMKEKLKSMFGPESMKRNMQQMVAVYPDVLVGVGDTWKDQTALAGEFGLQVNNTYKLEEINDNAFVLSLDSEINTDKDAKIDLGLMAVEYDLDGSQEGTLEMDRKTGMLIRSHLDQSVKGSMSISGMNIPINMKSTIVAEPY